ncbi:MAG: DUF2851 family protein [Candidatus Nitrospinota bacterium M3_3B_026]
MFSREYLDLAGRVIFAIRERAKGPPRAEGAPPTRYSERIVQTLWMEQPWGPGPVRDTKRRGVRIISPGWLNGAAGPDFKGAVFNIDGGEVERGDVELHVRSSDWRRHKHHLDPAYNNVKLHVVIFQDSTLGPQRRQDGRRMIEIELAPACPAAIDKTRAALAGPPAERVPELSGRCGEAMARIGEKDAGRLLDAAGEGRMTLKSERYLSAIRKGRGEEALYRGLAEALGFRSFKTQFGQLAENAPLDVLREVVYEVDHKKRYMTLQALFLGLAGLAPDPSVKEYDHESEKLLARLWAAWKEISARYGLRAILRAEDWKTAGARPANFPAGRLVGLARFLSIHLDSALDTLFIRLAEDYPAKGPRAERVEWLAKVASFFQPPDDDYWPWRYVIGGKKLRRPRSLVGPGRVEIILVNIVIPFLLARARVFGDAGGEERLRLVFHGMPGLEENHITKFMAARMLPAMKTRAVMKGAARRQGLAQVYADFCLTLDAGCAVCPFAAYLERLAPGGLVEDRDMAAGICRSKKTV